MVSQIQQKNICVGAVGGWWWSNIAEEDEGVSVPPDILVPTTSGLED